MKNYQCTIESVTQLNASTKQVVLAPPKHGEPVFKAGQYLEIVLPSGKKCPFSIANSPGDKDRIELHIRPTPDSADSRQIEELLIAGGLLDIRLPMGKCYMETIPRGPVLLMAASTGITQMKSILEYLLEAGLAYPVFLYWGVLVAEDLYLDEQFRELASNNLLFHYVPVVSEPHKSINWQGRTGLLADAALADIGEFNDLTIYVSGGPAMVYATMDLFTANGMQRENMHSDVFDLSPREQ